MYKNKRSSKKVLKEKRVLQRRSGSRPVLNGESIFDLIIPWKEKKPKDESKKHTVKKATQTSLASFLSKNNKTPKKDEVEKPQAKAKNENDDLINKGLAQVIHAKDSIINTNFDNYAKNVEAILVNPKWVLSKDKKSKNKHGITIEEFANIKFSKNLMIDGLLFIWVEKEIILDIIRIMEKQDLNYVENVCWVMLDETKRQCK